MTAGRRDLWIGLGLLVFAIGLPFVFPTRYILGQGVLIFIWATVISQWNLVFGVSGVFSLAQMAIFAMGGYAAAMLALYFGVPLWLGMFAGGAAAVVFSLLIGLACLRLRGPYVALLTLAISQAMYLLIITDTACFIQQGVTCRNFTGGTRGMSRFGDYGFRELLGREYAAFGDYFLSLAVLIAATLFAAFIMRSPLGYGFQALRDSPSYAMARGVSRFKYQLLVFAASAFFTGIAGAVYAGHFRVMGASVLYLSLLLYLLSMMVLGGLGSLWGPIAGTVLLMVIDEGLKEFVEWRLAGLGMILIFGVIFMPKGVVGVIHQAAEWLARKKRSAGAPPPAATTPHE
jgi:branched-chain amino acid transport system permease protein